ncbi:MAG: glutamate racemase [Parachlamydiales bacterium]|jgi:glutamate racemase
MQDLPIGIFDSGAGGLIVLRSVAALLPHESIVYFGDTARLPYGDKSCQTIEKYSRQCVQFLLDHPVKMVVIACNTASSFTSQEWKDSLPVPVIDVLYPSAFKASTLTQNQCIGVLGTHATIRSGSYQKALHTLLPHAHILPVACPLFVPLVEEMLLDHPATHLMVQEYLKPILDAECDTVILGCTHYPLLRKAISKQLPSHVHIVDSAQCCAEAIQQQLKSTSLKSSKQQFYVTDDPGRFKKLAQTFLPSSIQLESLELIHLDN